MTNPVRYAGFWIRFVADVFDSIAITAASWIVTFGVLAVFALFTGESVPSVGSALSSVNVQFLNMGLYFCCAFPYTVWSTFRYGATPGKWLVGVQVVGREGFSPITLKQSIIRFFAYGPSYLLFFTGFLMAAFHPEKRALHDLIAGTLSIRGRRAASKAGA